MRHGSRRAARDLRFRRSPHLVLYWRGETLIVRNYASGRSAAANALICRLLDVCGEWRTLAAVGREIGEERSPEPQPQLEEALKRLSRWLDDITAICGPNMMIPV